MLVTMEDISEGENNPLSFLITKEVKLCFHCMQYFSKNISVIIHFVISLYFLPTLNLAIMLPM